MSDTPEKQQTITYSVNGESQTTTEKKLIVREILTNAGFSPAEDYQLQRDNGSKLYTNLDEEVPLHDDERFTALFKGPTPVS